MGHPGQDSFPVRGSESILGLEVKDHRDTPPSPVPGSRRQGVLEPGERGSHGT